MTLFLLKVLDIIYRIIIIIIISFHFIIISFVRYSYFLSFNCSSLSLLIGFLQHCFPCSFILCYPFKYLYVMSCISCGVYYCTNSFHNPFSQSIYYFLYVLSYIKFTQFLDSCQYFITDCIYLRLAFIISRINTTV